MTTSNPTSSASILQDVGLWRMLLDNAKQQNLTGFKALLSNVICQIDGLLSEQLSAVIQDPAFKQLESSWTNVQNLTCLPVSTRRVKIKLIDVSWPELSADLNQSFDLSHSALYKKVYANELNTAGGQPFGLLVADRLIQFDLDDEANFDDLYTLQLLAELGERSLCPVALGLNQYFFGDDPARLIHDQSRIKRILTSLDFQSWQLLRQRGSSRFLNIVLPEYRLRSAYQSYPAGFVFNETPSEKAVLWGNAAYLLAANVIREFDRISWFGFLRAYDESGNYGAIIHTPANDASNREPLSIDTRINIYSEHDSFWSEQGFVPITSVYLSDQKGFFSNQSVWQPTDETSRVNGMLQTNLMACRFAHYIKAQIRDRIGSFDSAATCERDLEHWLQNYISGVDYGDESIMARYPLKQASVTFTQDSFDTTKYRCQIHLQPQYQYEMLDTHIVLLTDVSARKLGEANE
ncbi:type VI secretion system contractile sheath domain-containing protein [Photobacterium swingsii]|uniref:type VI secretion system contractile sheath domain-containing protein n=1 Tax=Photobacterium swingsii TaxID=680026 RepID=UPI00406929D0